MNKQPVSNIDVEKFKEGLGHKIFKTFEYTTGIHSDLNPIFHWLRD